MPVKTSPGTAVLILGSTGSRLCELCAATTLVSMGSKLLQYLGCVPVLDHSKDYMLHMRVT